MKSAVVATVFTYLIGALAAPVGSNVNTTAVDASALHAVLNGTVTVSSKDAKLVDGLVAALADRDAPTARNSTAIAPAAPSSVTAQISVGSEAAKILEDVDKVTGGLIFQGMSPEDKKKLTDLLKSSHPELIPSKVVFDEAEGATQATEQNLTSILKNNGVTEAAIRKMYDQGLISDLVRLLGGLFKDLPVAGPLASSAIEKAGSPVDGLTKDPLGAVGGVGKNPKGTVSNLVGDITGSAKGAATSTAAASDLTKDPLGAVGGLLRGVTGATKVAAGATDSVSDLTKDPLGAVESLLGDATGATNGATSTAKSAAGASPTGAVSGLLKDPLGAVGKTVGDIGDTAMGATGTLANAAKLPAKREEQPVIDTEGLRLEVPGIESVLAAILEGINGSVKASSGSAPAVSGTPKPDVGDSPTAGDLTMSA